MRGVFLDTSAVFAAARSEAAEHTACRRGLESLIRGRTRMITTELVIAELHALATTRVNPHGALMLTEQFVASPRIDVVTADRALREQGLGLLRSRPGRSYSLTDAMSFVVMLEMGIDTAFTLDADFAAEGFTLLPGS